jgi:hypothetical protein
MYSSNSRMRTAIRRARWKSSKNGSSGVVPAYMSRTHLKRERKWTDRLITDFLDEPDWTRTKSGSRAHLFKIARAAESRDDFKAAFGKRRKRT